MTTKSNTGTGNSAPPRWDMTTIYPSPDGPEFASDLHSYRSIVQQLREMVDDGELNRRECADRLPVMIELINRAGTLLETLQSYAYCLFSTAADTAEHMKLLNRIEQEALPFQDACVRFRNTLADLKDRLPALYQQTVSLEQYRFFIDEQLHLQEFQMSPAEEGLAADLQRSGAEAWSRLQEQISSTLTAEWDAATGETRTVVQLRNMAHNTSRSIRRRAFETETAAWKSMETPLAAALNGVKGCEITLARRRGYKDPLEPALQQSRISPEALDALVSAMENRRPQFHGYLKTKARLLGLEQLAFYDLFAPIQDTSRRWSFEEARRFIQTEFSSFSPDLGAFAGMAFDNHWIDAEPRAGKVGGAYCIDLPGKSASRILCNFEGSFSDVSTIAHELGHAYHSSLLRDYPPVLTEYPMTLAETASIFCETMIFNARVSSTPREEQLPLLEHFLQETTQMIIDILSRYYFEQQLFARRSEGELSAGELCELMHEAQVRSYGDGIDPQTLHYYMWAVKGHYYIPSLSYYNFPYAFGLLFGLGLFQQYRQDPAGFPARYRELLRATGRMSTTDVTRQAGFSIETRDFWDDGLALIGQYIDQFTELSTAEGTAQLQQ
ncbi:MAG: M3 family oligoendopeptidase [Spirochaeta sp.]